MTDRKESKRIAWYWPAWQLTNPVWPIVWRGGDEWNRSTVVIQPPLLGAFIIAYSPALARMRRFYWQHVRRYHYEICGRCGKPATRALGDTYWFAPDDLWNEVIGGSTGIRCAECFESDSSASGISVAWKCDRMDNLVRSACQSDGSVVSAARGTDDDREEPSATSDPAGSTTRAASGSTTLTYGYFPGDDGMLHKRLVGVSTCCTCEEPTEDYVLCPNCGSVKR